MAEQETPPLAIVDDLIESLTPKEDTFDVPLEDKTGRVVTTFKFRVVRDYVEWQRTCRKARKWIKDVTNGSVSPQLKEYLPPTDDLQTLFYVYILSACCLEPVMSQADWCKLARKAGFVFEDLKTQFTLSQGNVSMEELMEKIEESKNNSSETPPDVSS